MLDITTVPLDDEFVWDMICDGRVKGCFQIESNLGKAWCKKIRPRSIKELSDVLAIVRPGILKFVYDGKSMAQHYVDRKFGLEPIVPLHESLTDILASTYQIILYQEQIIQIGRKIAGFDDAKSRNLQKSIGKKDAELLFSLEEKFVEGCKSVGLVSEQDARLIFNNIKKSARYLFNLSHSVAYAHITYWCTYIKHHRQQKFYLNWLQQAKEKIDPDQEVRELISSAKQDGIAVNGPSLAHMNENFCVEKGNIYFGFCNVKNVGKIEFQKIKDRLSKSKLDDWKYLLIYELLDFNKRTIDNLIYAGTFDYLKIPRMQMIHELVCMRELTDKELEWLRLNYTGNFERDLTTLSLPKKEGGGSANKNRSKLILEILVRISNPGRDLGNNPATLCKIERELLGCELSFSELDTCRDATFANCSCVDFVNRNSPKLAIIACVVKTYREHVTKNKEQMCFLTVEDNSGELENIVIFPNVYSDVAGMIYDGSTILLTGERSNKGDNAFIVQGIDQI